MYLVAPGSLCVLIFTSFANLMPYLPMLAPLLRGHFTFPSILSSHIQPICVVSDQLQKSCAKPSMGSDTFLCPWVPGPLKNDFICLSFFFLNKIKNSFNHPVLMIFPKKPKWIKDLLPEPQLELQSASGRTLTEAQMWEMHFWGFHLHEMGSDFMISTQILWHF